MPIDYVDYLDVLFLYIGLETPLHMNMMICFIYGCKPIIDGIYACLCWAWTMKHMIDEMFCVERDALEHLSD